MGLEGREGLGRDAQRAIAAHLEVVADHDGQRWVPDVPPFVEVRMERGAAGRASLRFANFRGPD